MSNYPYDDLYASGDPPWDIADPDPRLVDFVRSGGVQAGRALEIGCGTGTNALWLAEQGFGVIALDISGLAIQKANAKLGARGLPCRFLACDFMRDELPAAEHQLVFDRGCFHLYHDAPRRALFAARVARALAPGGLWLSLIGSTEGPPREGGPPRRSAREIVEAVEPLMEIVELRSSVIHLRGAPPTEAWSCVARRRATPAQPSTFE